MRDCVCVCVCLPVQRLKRRNRGVTSRLADGTAGWCMLRSACGGCQGGQALGGGAGMHNRSDPHAARLTGARVQGQNGATGGADAMGGRNGTQVVGGWGGGEKGLRTMLRSMTISSLSSVKMALLSTTSRSWWYPWVKNRMAFTYLSQIGRP